MRSAFLLAAVIVTAVTVGGCGSRSADFVDIPGIGATRVDVPRPTGGSSAACDGDPLPPASDVTIAERVADLRAIGLFADRGGLSDEALAAEIESVIVERSGSVEDVPDELADLVVADQDATRVWWQDLEADVTEANDVYALTLAEWSEISVGTFKPTEISESWEGDRGPITVTYAIDGIPHTLRPGYYDDFIDLGIIVGVNESIAGSGRLFESYKAFDQTAFVMALTDQERLALEERGWCFE